MVVKLLERVAALLPEGAPVLRHPDQYPQGLKAIEVVTGMLQASLPEGAPAENLVIAYEPVWAIGTGNVATVEAVDEMHTALRSTLVEIFGAKAELIPILYGGSMKPDNAAALLAVKNVNGGLIGGASLKAADFLAIYAEA